MDDFIAIPQDILPVTPSEEAALLAKRWQALNWLYDNPFAKAMHFRLLAHMKRGAKVVGITDLQRQRQ